MCKTLPPFSLILLCILFIAAPISAQNILDIELEDLQGQKTTLAQANADEVAVVAFWATWCGPCLKELGAINEKLDDWQAEEDFKMMAVSIDDARAKSRVKPMVDGKAWDFDVLIDANQDLARALNVPTPPYTVILKNGDVVYTKSGYKTGDEDAIFEALQSIETSGKGLNVDGLSVGLEVNANHYVDDDKTGDFLEDDRSRANSYLKVDYQFTDNISAGAQLESYEPQSLLNYSDKLNSTELGTYYAQYKNDFIEATAGHFYDQFGSGLILRAYEDRQLGLNTAIRGGRLKIRPVDYLTATALYGKQRNGLAFDYSASDILGIDLSASLPKASEDAIDWRLGASFVSKNEEMESMNPEFDENTTQYSGRLGMSTRNFYTNVEYAGKSEEPFFEMGNIRDDILNDGNALLFNTGYSKSGFGIDATIRRTENMSTYGERGLTGNDFNEAILNYVPALTKQQDYMLTNIYVYQAQPGVSFIFENETYKAGEIGGQIDVFYQFDKGSSLGGQYGTNVSLNASKWHNLAGDYNFDDRSYDVDYLALGEKYYSDVSLEVRKKVSEKVSGIFTYLRQDYDKRYIEGRNGEAKTNIFVLENTFAVNDGFSLRTEAQHLGTKTDDKNWWAGLVEANIGSSLSVFVSDLYNYGNDIEEEKAHYYNFGSSFTKGSSRLGLQYGRRRGGLLCVGGVCRIVSPSSGLALNFSTSF